MHSKFRYIYGILTNARPLKREGGLSQYIRLRLNVYDKKVNYASTPVVVSVLSRTKRNMTTSAVNFRSRAEGSFGRGAGYSSVVDKFSLYFS